MLFPFIDLVSEYNSVKADIDTAVAAVFDAARFIMGEPVLQFEEKMREYTGRSHALGVDSGTRALELIYRALGIGPGDEVITTPFSFVATASSILHCGATPVFADVDPQTMNIDPESVRQKITSKTKAITPVHLFGRMADMRALHDIAGEIPLVEDACQAIGAFSREYTPGSCGVAAALSFFPTKNLGGAGDGGMVLTDCDPLAKRIVSLRNHGQSSDGSVVESGCTGRLDAVQAAVLSAKLPFLDEWNSRRRENAQYYIEHLSEAVVPQSTDTGHVYHQFTIRCHQRDQLRIQLADQGIPTAVYYPQPIHLQPLFRKAGSKPGDCPRAKQLCNEVLSLPIGPFLRPEHRELVVTTLNNII